MSDIPFVVTYTHLVPWGVVRIEGMGSGSDIPELDPTESPLEANEGCVAAAVVHPDISAVRVQVRSDGTNAGEALVFDGEIAAPEGVVEVADLVGDDFSHRFKVAPGAVNVKVYMDDPAEATAVTVVLPVLAAITDT